MSDQLDQWVTVGELAEKLALSRRTVLRMVQAGHFGPPLRLTRKATRLSLRAVQAFIDARLRDNGRQSPAFQRTRAQSTS